MLTQSFLHPFLFNDLLAIFGRLFRCQVIRLIWWQNSSANKNIKSDILEQKPLHLWVEKGDIYYFHTEAIVLWNDVVNPINLIRKKSLYFWSYKINFRMINFT